MNRHNSSRDRAGLVFRVLDDFLESGGYGLVVWRLRVDNRLERSQVRLVGAAGVI